MIVIGNDLLKIKDADNKYTFDRNGVDRFFKHDTFLSHKDEDQTVIRFCLWSMKESAYKCMQKLGHNTAFSPAKFKVKAWEEGTILHGIVSYNDLHFYTKCIEDGEYVRCVATNNAFSLNHIKSIHLNITDSQNKNALIIKKLSKLNQNQKLVLAKTETNIPVLINDKGTQQLEISISDEGCLNYISILPEWVQISSPIYNNHKNAYAQQIY